MWNRLLAPFSLSHEVAHINDKIEHFYTELNRENLQARLRSELLEDDKRSIDEKHTLRQLFKEYAIEIGGAKVWDRSQFGRFMVQRRRDDRHLADILWRSFCYQASYPFPHESSTIDLDGFLSAVTRLTRKNAHRSLHSLEQRREWTWKRFASMSRPMASSSTAEGDWIPPNTLDNIAQVVRSQLPVPEQPYKIRAPPVAKVRPRVQGIFGDFPTISTAEFEISYQEMLALLTAIMRLDKNDEQSSRHWANTDDWPTATAVARAVLGAGQLEEDYAVTWSKYLSFSEKYHFDDHIRRAWAFDYEITDLWNAIFKLSAAAEGRPSSQHPSAVVLQGLDFITPLSSEEHDPKQRQGSLLAFSSDVTNLSRQAISQAFAGKFYSKVAVIDGSTKAQVDTDADGQPAMLAILTAAPPRNDDGYVDDFIVGDEHLLLELAPVARALWLSQPGTHYDDLVHITDNEISFGTGYSGLTIDLQTGTAVLTSDTNSRSYVQVAVGPAEAPLKALEGPLPFRTEVHVERVEIYDLPEYGPDDRLSIERPRSVGS